SEIDGRRHRILGIELLIRRIAGRGCEAEQPDIRPYFTRLVANLRIRRSVFRHAKPAESARGREERDEGLIGPEHLLQGFNSGQTARGDHAFLLSEELPHLREAQDDVWVIDEYRRLVVDHGPTVQELSPLALLPIAPLTQ